MTDHLEDADTWLTHAKDEKQNHRVSASMAVHSMIKTLNALFEEFLGEMPGRHDHATDYFKKMVDEGHLKPEESKYTNKIQSMLQKKADVDYKAQLLQQKRQRSNGKKSRKTKQNG